MSIYYLYNQWETKLLSWGQGYWQVAVPRRLDLMSTEDRYLINISIAGMSTDVFQNP